MPTQGSNAQLIEKVTYTASLASDATAIDTIMESLREVTARISSSDDLSTQDVATINNVQSKLENYLVTQENLRTFTPESLKLQIEQRLQGNDAYKRTRLQLAIALFLTVAAVVVATQLPGAPKEPFLLVRLAGFTAVAALHLSAAWLFLSALASFKSELRKAFIVLCIGIILLGLALLEQPIIELLSLRNTDFIGIFISIPLVIAAATIYTGIYLYARTVGVRSSVVWPLALGASVMVLVSFLSPHAPASEPELAYDIAATLQGWVAIFPIISLPIMTMVVHKLAEIYKPPARALQQALVIIILVTVYVYAVRLIGGSKLDGIVGIIALTLLILEGVYLVRAGYVFNKVSRY